ncbi:MAG TPA: hypothetical protein VIW24_19000 [Aldersonia sp.]
MLIANERGGPFGQAGGLAAADEAFHPGVHAVARLEPLELAAAGGGGQRLVPVAVELFEQRQLGAGLDLFAPHDDPHPARPGLEPVATGTVAQQPGHLGDLRFVAGRAGGVERGLPRVLGRRGDRGPDPLVEVESATGSVAPSEPCAPDQPDRAWLDALYGAFYRSALYPVLQRINAYLMRWIRGKYRRLGHGESHGAMAPHHRPVPEDVRPLGMDARLLVDNMTRAR